MNNFKVLMNGIVKENPTFVLLLGMCPTLRLEFLICRNTVSIDIAASDCVLSLLAGVA